MANGPGTSTRPLETFLELLRGVQIDGRGSWKAYCPIHEDDGGEHNPSLQVTETDTGKVLAYCHVCKDKNIGPRICNKFGIGIRALFPDYGLPENRKRGRKRKIEGRKVAEYEYRDVDGAVVYKAMRYETDDGKKTFAQARPNGQGGWVYNMRGIRRVPYRLPELIASGQKEPPPVVYVCEGEKKVESLAAWGQVATCNVGGAGKWNREYAAFFRGRRVVILPDNDPVDSQTGLSPGKDHARKVLDSMKGFASAARILELPGLPPKGDIVDWQAAGHTLAELLQLTDALFAGGAAATDGESPEAQQLDLLDLRTLQGRTDVANGKRLIRDHGENVRFCQPMDKWLIWTGRRWQFDNRCRIELLAKRCTEQRWVEATDMAADISEGMLSKIHTFLKYSDSKNGVMNAIKLARSEPSCQVIPSQLDANPWLLNCRNGTLDLQSGELHPHIKGDLVTKASPIEFNIDAACPIWERFVRSVFGGNDDLVGYVQRLCGYWATGLIREQMLPILWGGGANGKSTFLNVVMDVLGRDYSMKATQEFLMVKKGDAHPTDKADLFGKRFVACSETEEGRRLSESLVKEITGGERIRARRMREDFWEFEPTHKVVLITNHKPVVSGGDHGIWRRIRLIPFEHQFWDADNGESGPEWLRQDKELPNRLKLEYSGILTWIVRGCLAWQHDGEQVPSVVREGTTEYRDSQDVIAQWIEECCEMNTTATVQSSKLYGSYKEWCLKSGEYPVSQRRFGGSMTDRGFRRFRANGIWYVGIDLVGFN